MKGRKLVSVMAVLLIAGSLLLGGCGDITPTVPQSSTPPTSSLNDNSVKVVYNYNDTDKVQLSDNNIVVKVGQQLIIQPAPGLTADTHFTSSGDNFFGDIMQQQTNQPDNGKLVFLATKPGKGKLTIIPNNNDTARATDLWVTVQ